MKKIAKQFSLILALLIIALSFFSCGGNSKGSMSYEYDGNSSDYDIYDSPIEKKVSEDVEQKLVINSTIECETKEFDKAVEEIKKSVTELGGYIQSSTLRDKTNRYGSRTLTLVCRIPSEKYQSFDDVVSGNTSVIYKNSDIADITESYYSVKSKYESLLIQEERLLAMLEKATELSEMLLIEDKLAEVRGNIQSYETTLKTYDNRVSYATASITLTEVKTYTQVEEETFGSRIASAFSESWINFADGFKDFVVWFISAIPTLMILAIIIVIIVVLIKSTIKRKKAKKENANKQ